MAEKFKIPEGYEWEVHNTVAHAEKKKAFEQGRITLTELQEFEWKYRESEEQRALRWRREHIMAELERENASNFRALKRMGKHLLKKCLTWVEVFLNGGTQNLKKQFLVKVN